MRRASAIAILVALAACSPPRRPVAAPQPSAADRLAVVDAELRAGCLDCLLDAFRQYEVLRQLPDVADPATAGAIRAAVLVAIREHELGMVDEGYLAKARELASAGANLPSWLPKIIDIADALPRGGVGRGLSTDADLARLRTLRTSRDAWMALLRDASQYDEAAAYSWLALTCESADTRNIASGELFQTVSTFAAAPLIVYREATCRTLETATLQSLLDADARFAEISYSLGLAALGARPRPKLDDAEPLFQRAYDWRPVWPSLTLAMAGVAMTAEDFDRARVLYEETLAADPHSVDGLLGQTRALTYLARNAEAIVTADRLIAEKWYTGDALYWRAFNELQLSRHDAAWTDIERADSVLINAEVPKLAGMIAYRRQQPEIAITRFATAQQRNPFDCQTRYFLGVIHAELRHWADAATTLGSTVTCLENAETALREEIGAITASAVPPQRRQRQIAKREQQIAEGRRMIATSCFDTAVAFFSLSKKDEARQYAEKVADDEQFGARARELLARLR